MSMFNEYSYMDYLEDFLLQDKLKLIEECNKILSESQKSILEPFPIKVNKNNYRLMKFINDSLLCKKSQLGSKSVEWYFDPATESNVLSDFIHDSSIYKVGEVELNLLSGKLRIIKQTKEVNLNHSGIGFLLLLLSSAPNIVTYQESLDFLDSSPSAPSSEAVATIRRDLFRYLKAQGFSKESINHLKSKMENKETIGYQIDF